jgi:hypothetical protein
MSSAVATLGFGARPGAGPGAASGASKVKAFAGVAADAMPIPTQSSCKNARRSMRSSQEMSELPRGNARQHDSVPNWLAGFFEEFAFSEGSGQARADAEGERVKKTERRRSTESVKNPTGASCGHSSLPSGS